MLNLTEVMPGGWPDSDTLRSRDCVTGDSFLEDYIIMLIMMEMEKINMAMILHNLRVFFITLMILMKILPLLLSD